jgi:glycosyltransferase involved in cell wall biosynthesis
VKGSRKGAICFRISAIVPASRTTGASFYSDKLYTRLPAEQVSAKGSPVLLIKRLFRKKTDLYHIQFEYRGFGSFPKSLALLSLLSIILSARRSVVITLHGIITRDASRGIVGFGSYFAFLIAVRLAAFFATTIVVHSTLMKRILTEQYHVHNVTMIPHGTDVDHVGTTRSPKKNHLLFFGFVRPSKGIENLIESVAVLREELPDIMLTVAGTIARPEERGYAEGLRETVAQLGVSNNVVFKTGLLGVMDRDSLAAEAECLVLPYTDKFVEVSGVVHDFAGYGIPLVCTDVPRFSEMVNEYDCLKVAPGAEGLADAISRILSHPSIGKMLAANLRLRAREQSWDVVALQHLSLYRRCINGEA